MGSNVPVSGSGSLESHTSRMIASVLIDPATPVHSPKASRRNIFGNIASDTGAVVSDVADAAGDTVSGVAEGASDVLDNDTTRPDRGVSVEVSCGGGCQPAVEGQGGNGH